jgi:hypothetical protein
VGKKRRAKYAVPYMSGQQKRISLMVDMGNCCKLCGYYKPCALEFHHVGKKRFTLDARTLGQIRDLSLIKSEAKRCVLLCANCHKEVHAGLITLERR